MSDAERRNLLAHFREEAEEHVDLLLKSLLGLEALPGDDRVVEDMLRRAHNLKGAAKLVGGAALERLTHAFETILSEVRAKRLAPGHDVVDALLESVDAMRNALERLMAGQSQEGSEDVVSRLLSLAASAPGIDDRLATLLPGLDPEIRDVLTEF